MSKILVVLSMLLMSVSAFAQDKKKEAAPAASAQAEVKKEEVDEADKLITNRRLRADMGSTSNWSVRTFWNYQGGTIEKPASADRPNIDAGADNLTLANGSGNVGVRYRMTKFESLNLSIGLNMTTPFHSSFKTTNTKLQENFDKNSQKLTANDPTLTYNKVASIWGFQTSTNVSFSYITNAQLETIGYRNLGSVSSQWMKDLGKGWTAGVGAQYLGYTFNSNYKGGPIQDRSFVLFPAAEYVINDTLLWRIVYRRFYDRMDPTDSWTYRKRKDSISTGIGISLGRDVFLYPNIQFIPTDIRSDRTNVAMSANINLF